ncbi:MAG TPA: YihY/virulence factor BrkB family protein [Candidatus Saccharimonadales bacterium]|nr:YihY/virulence factor BrkB family protein [Candidatus Saccharimonadales bacterium]
MTETKTTHKLQENSIQRLLRRIDAFQQRHPVLAVPYAVIKKYGDDEAGYQGALLSYYGFVSLFPLLIVATSVIDLITRHDQALRDRLLGSITGYFPAIGSDLQSSIHTSGKSGIGLAIGLLITFYGARGGADAVRHAMDHIWQVPHPKRAGFPKGILKSLGLIVGGGIGLLAAAFLSSYATAFGHAFIWRALVSLASLFILFWTFCFLFRFATSSKHKLHDNFPGAILAATGLQILQTLGGYLITHQLKNLNGLNAQFAVVLALLFWLYLQAQVFLYAAEVNTVRTLRLWPRSITSRPLTAGDKKAFELYAKRASFQSRPTEEVHVDFH